MGLLPPPPPDDEDRSRFPGGADGPESFPENSSRDESSAFETARTDLRVVVPDDLRSLDAEVRAVQAELGIELPPEPPLDRRQRIVAWFGRRARAGAGTPRVEQGWPPPRGLARVLLVAPVVALTLLVVAALAALVPNGDQAPRRSVTTPRLATPTAAPGEVGGLLPDVLLGGPAGQMPARDLRPAVLMLVPDGCACPQLVHQVIGQVEEYPGLDSAVIGSGDPGVAALASDRAGGDNRLPALTDAQSVLARTYHGGPAGSVPTLLFVAADGRLTAPPLVFTPGTRIESSLLPLVPLRA